MNICELQRLITNNMSWVILLLLFSQLKLLELDLLIGKRGGWLQNWPPDWSGFLFFLFWIKPSHEKKMNNDWSSVLKIKIYCILLVCSEFSVQK